MRITIHHSDVEMAEHTDNCSKMRTNGMGDCNCGADSKTEELRRSGFKTFAEWAAAKNPPPPVPVAKPKEFTIDELKRKITIANIILTKLDLDCTPECASKLVALGRLECNCRGEIRRATVKAILAELSLE